MFKNNDNVVTLVPLEDSGCFVNNFEIRHPTKLSQG